MVDGMEVIGVGLSRTGTSSFREALHILGFVPCYHDGDVLGLDQGPNAGHLDAWHRFATEGVPPDWHHHFAHYRAIGLLPGIAAYFEQVVTAFPDARVVLTRREVHGWVRSVRTLHEFFLAMGEKELMRSEVGHRWRTVMSKLAWARLGDLDDGEELVQHFEHHHQRVVASVPADRLLVFDVREGWEPLCAFLGIAVPDVPFPKINESAFLEHAQGLDGAELMQALSMRTLDA